MSAYLGIDIAKATFTVALRQTQGVIFAEFANTPTGFDQLQVWWTAHGVQTIHACLEATGRYGQALAAFLWQQRQRVSVVNPKQTKAFAKTVQARSKNDRVDAALLAQYAELHQPRLWSPPDPARERLQQLTRQRLALRQIEQGDRNRFQSGAQDAFVQQMLEQRLAFYAQQLADLEAEIQQHIAQHAELKQQRRLLTSIPGIGDVTAAVILGELPDIRRFQSASQLVAYVGVDPSEHSSGTSVRKPTRISKQGNARLRCALFFPSVVGKSRCAFYQPLVRRLEAKQHCKMSIVIAVMRKQLHLIFGVLKHGRPFDPLYLEKKALALAVA